MNKIIINGISDKNFIEKYAYDFQYIINRKTDLDSLSERYYRKGKSCWVMQTLINLNYYYGDCLDIRLTNKAQDNAINILHYDNFSSKTKPWRGNTIVCQADRPSVHGADYVIVQNPLQAKNGKIFIPHWPQPGLKPRAKNNGEIKTIGFFGHEDALPDFFSDKTLEKELNSREINFIKSIKDWTDYSNIDIAISFRHDHTNIIRKPASKLINAWNAGCPVICDDEPSMRAIKLSELDYLIAKTPEKFIDAVDKLRNQPNLYLSMISNGKRRFAEYTRESTAQKWFRLIQEVYNNNQNSKKFSRSIKFYFHKLISR
ncbi:glycosyltransferase [Xenorhabdus budapestensis]|uniref:Glycosyltransferase n=1 Tax=Xenorhabdus budapestensis TaxID=290110 RepID=A0ABX7VEA6_XENBU|nr:glycosyltransferase [Xenorhabdus budapestensis]QTL39134.1 glycosyltransferase [Xenorhabdus budapestensis]